MSGKLKNNMRRSLRRVRNRLKIITRLFQVMQVRWYQLAIPVGLSLAISTLDAVGLSLLAPLTRGVLMEDFSGVRENFALDWFFQLFERFGELDSISIFFLLASLIFLINIFSIAVGYANAVYGRVLQGLFQYRLNTAVYDRYFAFGKRFFDQTSQGSIKKILEYTTRIVELIKVTQNTTTNVLRLFAHLVVLLWLSWKLFLFILVVFPVLYVLSRIVMKLVDRFWERALAVTLDLGREAFNMLSALPLVWSYSKEGEAKRVYAKMSEELRRVQVRAHSWGELTVFLPRTITLFALLGVVAFISFVLVDEATVDLGIYIVFLYVASRTLPLFKVFNSFWVAVSELRPPILEVLSLFEDKDKHVVPEGDKQFSGLKESIEFSSLTFKYGDARTVLQDVSFSIPKGKVTAVVGPSGAGKSTLTNLLMRFYDCPPGSVFLDGVDIREFSNASIRSHMALVTQQPLLLNDTLYANLTYGLDTIDEHELNSILRRCELASLVDRLPEKLDTVIGDRGEQLSGGEKQRISIARALMKGSEVLLLDEATSALDSETELLIQQAIEEAVRDKTALVIAHRLSTIKNASHIVYLENGRVEETGSLSELLDVKGKFYAQWKAQMFD